MKKHLMSDKTIIDMFKEYDVDIDELKLIPMSFSDLDVSAKCDHGVIYFNKKLINNLEDYYSYAVHEICHYLQQTTGKNPTTSSNNGNYLDNKYEQEGFAKQVSYISDNDGDKSAKEYVNDLLEYHEIKNDSKKDELEAVLLKDAMFSYARTKDDILFLKQNIGNYVHFSDSDRFGISYHKDIHPGNPRGLYGFKLNNKIFNYIVNKEFYTEYFEKNFIYVYSISGKILNIDNINFKEEHGKIKTWILNNFEMNKDQAFYIKYMLLPSTYGGSDGSKFLQYIDHIINFLKNKRGKGNEHSLFNIILRSMGYDGLETSSFGFGDGLKEQVVVVNPSAMSLIGKINNPMLSKNNSQPEVTLDKPTGYI